MLDIKVQRVAFLTGEVLLNLSYRRAEAKELLASGQPQDAIAKLNKALALRPREAHLYHERAWAYQRTGDYSTAIQNVKKAMALGCPCSEASVLEEQLAELYVQFGEEYYAREQHEAALHEFSKASEIQPDHRGHILKRYVNKRAQLPERLASTH